MMRMLVAAVVLALLPLATSASETTDCFALGAGLSAPWEETAPQGRSIEALPPFLNALSLGAAAQPNPPCYACMKWCTQTLGQSVAWCQNECYWECL